MLDIDAIRGRDLLDVMSYEDIAKALHVKPTTLQRYKRGDGLPPPDDSIGATPVWFAKTIREWMRNRPRARANNP